MNTQNLKKRLFFVVWAIPVAWWIINSTLSLTSFIPQKVEAMPIRSLYFGQLLVILLIILATKEYLTMLKTLYPKNGFWLIYVWLTIQIISDYIPEQIFDFKQAPYILLLLVAFESFFWGKNTGRWKRASMLFSGTLFFLLAALSMLEFYDAPFKTVFSIKSGHPLFSQLGIITILAAIFLCDSAAYFAGTIFGKHHFSSISPKKTIEGSIAGLIVATISVTVGWAFIVPDIYPLFLGIILGIIVGIFAQIGDLLVSLIKRYFDVKDSSDLIPGHGGILDRFDSLFFTAPVVILFLKFITKIFT